MRREPERLQDILDAIAAIERYTSQGRQAFDEQELIQVWVIHHLQIIGEAANSLSGDLMNRYNVEFKFKRTYPKIAPKNH